MNTIEKQAEEFVTTKYNGWISTIENMKIAYLAGASAMNGSAGVHSFQENVGKWMLECFGVEIMSDLSERNFRFLEESMELVQSLGCSKEDCLKLVDYVFNRPVGETPQEVGGVMVTLAALCNVSGQKINDCAETEISRCWSKIEKIRAKHNSKPKNVRTPLPGESVSSPSPQIKCDQCGGNGYIAGHHTDCDGSPDFCGSICPVKYECVKCNGTGFLAASPSPLEAETADKKLKS